MTLSIQQPTPVRTERVHRGRAGEPPAPLLRVASKSRGAEDTGNLVIEGENLQVLKSFGSSLDASIRCIYLDPPYNNQERYRHYDDVATHDEWLQMLRERLTALRPLLTPDGSIWISIDDGEVHYLKVAADAIFGRENFVTTVIWQQRTTRENRRVFSNDHEYLLVYAANIKAFASARNRLPATERLISRYRNPDHDPRGPWQSISANVQDGHGTPSQHYVLVAPNGKRHTPPAGRCWIYTKDRMMGEVAAGNVWFGKSGGGAPRLKRFLSDGDLGLTPNTLWLAADVGTNDEAKKALISAHPEHAVFDTPKPERLIERIVNIASNPGDVVLDPFLGSGTTSAVAHRLGRTHIGIEQNRAAAELAAERLAAVVESRDLGGASSDSANGFDYLRPA